MKSRTKIITSLIGITTFMSLALIGSNTISHKQVISPVKAEEDEDVLYFEDFSGDTMPEGWANFDLVDGKASFNANGTWTSVPIPASAFVSSNNYEFSFDFHYDSSADLYFHLSGLDTTTPGNIYLAMVAGGQYWRLANFGECDIYDNSGDDQGCNYVLPEIVTKMKEDFINVKFVVLDDVVEVYAEGRRLIAVPLSAFGNNRYASRREIVKGVINGFGIDCRTASGELVIDNFVMKEAKYGETYFRYADEFTGGTYYLPLTYANLYQDNFTMNADFSVHRTLVEDGSIDGYPRMGLIMNQIIPEAEVTLSEPTNSINAQNHLKGATVTPWIGGISPSTGNWSGLEGSTAQANFDDTRYTQTIDVLGDKITFTVKTNGTGEDNTSKFETSFSNLGLTKGKLLSALVGNFYTNVSNIEYFGYEDNFGVRAEATSNRVIKGGDVVVSAKTYGEATNDLVWYIDGEATEISDLTYTSNTFANGKHTFAYGNSTVKSNEVEVEVFENMITISADTTSIYPIESATFNAVAEGDFAGKTLTWKVNDTLLEGKTGETLVLEELDPGTYVVVCVCDDIVSNSVTLTVKEPKLTIAADKGAYDSEETATITASKLGIADDDEIKWFADGEELTGKTGDYIELALVGYKAAGQVEVQAKTEGTDSNTLTLFVTHDVYDEISSDENWKTAYTQQIPADSTFGSYVAVEDEGGNYYKPTNAGSGNDAQFPSIAIETQSWSMEYDLLIPDTVASYSGEYYVYPQAMGMDSKHPTDQIELAVAVGSTKMRTYVKTHIAGTIYEYSDFNTGKDLTYAGDIVNFGWNHIVFAMQGNVGTFYINNELVFYAVIPNSTVPSSFVMSMFPGSGGEIPLGFRNFTIKGIVEPAPSVSGVNVSASKVTLKVGESTVLNATVSPYNAGYETIEWYINGEKVENANTLTYTFTPTEAGEYSIVCKIDGISSSAKVITVSQGEVTPDKPTKKGCGGSIIATSALISIASLVGFGFILAKKKKED